jgi:hypothetical protein
MSTDDEENPADLWLNLKSRCRKGLQDAFPPAWRYTQDLDVPREKAEDTWFAHCSRLRESVDHLVRQWLRSGAVESNDSELRYFLAVRFAVAHDFLTELTFVKGGEWTSFIPFPSRTPEEVLWLLLTVGGWVSGSSLRLISCTKVR